MAESSIRESRDAGEPNTVLQPPGWPQPASPQHIVRLTWYVRDMDEYLADPQALGAAYREIMGRHFPAMAVVEVNRLVEPQARIEIEATAVLP